MRQLTFTDNVRASATADFRPNSGVQTTTKHVPDFFTFIKPTLSHALVFQKYYQNLFVTFWQTLTGRQTQVKHYRFSRTLTDWLIVIVDRYAACNTQFTTQRQRNKFTVTMMCWKCSVLFAGVYTLKYHSCRDGETAGKYFEMNECPADHVMNIQSAVAGFTSLYNPNADPVQCPGRNCTNQFLNQPHSVTESVPATSVNRFSFFQRAQLYVIIKKMETLLKSYLHAFVVRFCYHSHII